MSDPAPQPASQHTEYVYEQCKSLSTYFLVASILEAVAFGLSWAMNVIIRCVRTTSRGESEAQVIATPSVWPVLPPALMAVFMVIWGASMKKDMLGECRAALGPDGAKMLWYYAMSLNLYMAGMGWVMLQSLLESYRRRRLRRMAQQKELHDNMVHSRIIDEMSPAGITKTTALSSEDTIHGVASA